MKIIDYSKLSANSMANRKMWRTVAIVWWVVDLVMK